MTAAHDTLPLGTRVLVTTQETGRSALVTITDRLPPKHLRIIDVSRAAAAKLGLLGSGVGMVTLSTPAADEVIEVAEAPEGLDGDDAVSSPRRHGPRHTRPAARRVSAHR
jgi:rare lipoprotein A